MKTLSILRHAKSSWEFTELDDYERPLLNKGVKRTLRICKVLVDAKYFPDLILSSPAKRAAETASVVIEKLSVPLAQLQLSEQLYPGNEESILKEISQVKENIKHLMVVGHNPGLTDLAFSLTKNDKFDWIPTSGLVQIEFKCSKWSDIDFSNAKLKNYYVPKLLKETDQK